MHAALLCLAQEKIQEFCLESQSNDPFFSRLLYSLELNAPQKGQINIHFVYPR
jgi:hypothetical protein